VGLPCVSASPRKRIFEGHAMLSEIFVHDLSGDVVCKIHASAASTGSELKKYIQIATGLRQYEQRLVAGDRTLDDEDILGPGMFAVCDPGLTLLKVDPGEGALEHLMKQSFKFISQGGSLYDLDDDCRRCKELVLMAMKRSVTELKFAARDLKEDPDFMLSAIQTNLLAASYAEACLWSNRKFVLGAVRLDGSMITRADSSLQEDREIAFAAVSSNAFSLRDLSIELQSDRNIVLAAVQRRGTALCFASSELKLDRDIVLTAVTNSKMAYVHAAQELKNDEEIRRAAGLGAERLSNI